MYLRVFLALVLISNVQNLLHEFGKHVIKVKKTSTYPTDHSCQQPKYWTNSKYFMLASINPLGIIFQIFPLVPFLTEFLQYDSWNTYNYRVRELKDLKLYNDSWYHLPKNYIFFPTKGLTRCLNKDPGSTGCTLHDICLSFYERGVYGKYDTRVDELGDEEKGSEIISMHWNYYRCLRNLDTYYTCPNLCNNNPCVHISNSDGNCVSFFDRKHPIKLDYRAQAFRMIFQQNFTCRCNEGFKWNFDTQACDRKAGHKTCSCNNHGGECDENGKCICKPAWSGEKCEIPINPCNNYPKTDKCGVDHICSRDVRSETGYNCGCDKTEKKYIYAKVSSDGKRIIDPRCIDLNECQTHYKDKCINGGKCKNNNGSYYCDCPEDFEGENCELRKYVYLIQWFNWGPWSECSSPCFKGHKIQTRRCTMTNMCHGKDTRINSCDNSNKEGCSYYKESNPPVYTENKTVDIRRWLDYQSFKLYLKNQNDVNNAKKISLNFSFFLFNYFLIKF
jgi:hypothetical protein